MWYASYSDSELVQALMLEARLACGQLTFQLHRIKSEIRRRCAAA